MIDNGTTNGANRERRTRMSMISYMGVLLPFEYEDMTESTSVTEAIELKAARRTS